MKPEAQIRALAELDGYRCLDVTPPLRYLTASGAPAFAYILGSSGWFWTSDTPDYLNSYDAIIPLIQKLKVWKSGTCFDLQAITPAQLCEALLRAHGLWEEESV